MQVECFRVGYYSSVDVSLVSTLSAKAVNLLVLAGWLLLYIGELAMVVLGAGEGQRVLVVSMQSYICACKCGCSPPPNPPPPHPPTPS